LATVKGFGRRKSALKRTSGTKKLSPGAHQGRGEGDKETGVRKDKFAGNKVPDR